MKTCCVLGLGYIGLPTAAVLASSGHRVIGVDLNPKIVSKVNQGLVHIIEPGLSTAVSQSVASGLLTAQTSPCQADVFIIAVPTPFHSDTQNIPSPNLQFVFDAVRSICPFLKPGNLILIESTSPVGTTEQVAKTVSDLTSLEAGEIHIAYCPERVLPGNILNELTTNDRVIGGLTPTAAELGKNIYSTFCSGNLLETNSRTAELVKLAENSFRDVNIAFANELSLVCHHLGIDALELIALANHHPRVNVLQPGCGVGGHCIAVDPWFIAAAAPHCTPLIQTARKVNDAKRDWVVQEVKERALALEGHLCRPVRVGCLGLSFKPNVDDLRESPALRIVNELVVSGLDILACEPNLDDHPTLNLYSLEYVLGAADLLVFLVAHSSFSGLKLAKRPVFDLCGVTSIR